MATFPKSRIEAEISLLAANQSPRPLPAASVGLALPIPVLPRRPGMAGNAGAGTLRSVAIGAAGPACLAAGGLRALRYTSGGRHNGA